MYIDIHTHSAYKEKDVIIVQNLFPEEINIISSKKMYTVGLHPWNVNEYSISLDIPTIEKVCSNSAVIAIGETGIDKVKSIPLDLQVEAFQSQIELSSQYKKPLIIHCVKAYNELLEIRTKTDTEIPWIIHWFNASYEMALQLIRKNCYLSYGVMLFKETSKAYDAFKKLPIERIFFETDDAGYSIQEVYKKAAELKNLTVAKLQKQIEINFKNCFGIKI